MRTRIPPIITLILLILSGCASSRTYVNGRYRSWEAHAPPPDSALTYQAFLIGDAGGIDRPEPVIQLLETRLDSAGKNAVVVFLGDNIYCCGLRDSTDLQRRQKDERRLLEQLRAVDAFQGRVLFIPGNHDWNHSQPGGLEAVNRQEAFVETYLHRGDTFLPNDGFPGPVEVELTDRLTLIALDTEWWLSTHTKPYGDTGEHDLEEDADFLLQLDDMLKRNRRKDVLVVGHHPLFSVGVHAGRLPLREHLFPLQNLHKALVVPLPLLGSIYPLYVRYFGGRQDLAHPRYKTLRSSLRRIFSQHDHLIYAAGHEHNLQYFKEQTPSGLLQHHIISGSGSRPTPVGRGRGAVFTYGEAGFSVLKYYKDGSVWMEMWAPEAEGTKGRLLFRTELKTPARELVNPEIVSPVEPVDYTDSTVVMAVNPAYEAGALKRFFLGSHHREAWATPVEVPVLDLGREAGGLRPEKRGGGQQTTSLRLQGGDGQEYVLRSIDKDPSRTVPQNLQGTIATDIVQDQIASIHPFGAFIIPRLAAAAGVYHTNPRPVYVPHDPRLGLYQDFFSGHVVMLEERPDDDMSHAPRFGRSKQIISPHKLYREINDDNDHRVDLRAYARARLFDMLLSDWDRHVDQWRWASFEPHELDPTLEGEARTEGKVYRPIPRDRDFAFNRMNGLFPPIISIFDPKFQDFTESYGLLKGLNWNALRQDQRFTSGLERSDWIEIADSLRAALTDEVIEAAVREWPEPIYALDGEKTARLLRIRRDKLPDIAARFYALQARVVDVVGSNKHERFEVTRLNKDSTLVVVYKTSKSGRIRRMLYRRMFLEEETKEIRLYGLDGDDRFIVEGEVQDGIVIRAVGGAGHDRFVDRSQVLGASKHTRFYDTETGNEWDVGEETTTVRSDDDPAINLYNPADYKYNRSLPLTFFGSNKDDGFFIGGGISLIRHGFRKTPYAASHRIRANFAAKTQAFNIVYQGQFMSLIGHWDLTLDAAYLFPDNIRNFYGLGNETKNEERSRRFYQARLTQINLIPMLQKRIGLSSSFRFGPTFEVTKVGDNEDRFINQPQAGVSANTSDQWFVGANAALTLDTVDKTESLVNPMIGFKWTSTAAIHIGIENATETFSTLSTDLAVYLSPSLFPQVTVAARIGAAHNIGDFPFFSANTLGGISNLRGYRSTRFAGRSSVYQNVDLRLELFGFSSYLARGRFGVLGFFDHGRVWTDGERSKVWHQGYGGGVWIDMFNMFVLTGTAGFSEDDRTFTMKLGFQY